MSRARTRLVSRETVARASLALAALALVPSPASAQTETIDQALCRMIEGAAAMHRIPVEFFTRLIWRESNFRTGVRSKAGALGVAQFMPGTAAARGLADPFDPEQAIPKSAELLADLRQQFGNLGLAAVAYNGGPTRTANWLQGNAILAAETRQYVIAITGRGAEDWAEQARAAARATAPPVELPQTEPPSPELLPPELPRAQPVQDERAQDAPKQGPAETCLELVAVFRKGGGDRRIYEVYGGPVAESPLAPWGVQVAGNFSKDRALAAYARARARHASILSEAVPMVIGTRMLSRGTGAFYRVRIPAATQAAATDLCNRLRASGGACVVLKS